MCEIQCDESKERDKSGSHEATATVLNFIELNNYRRDDRSLPPQIGLFSVKRDIFDCPDSTMTLNTYFS